MPLVTTEHVTSLRERFCTQKDPKLRTVYEPTSVVEPAMDGDYINIFIYSKYARLFNLYIQCNEAPAFWNIKTLTIIYTYVWTQYYRIV